jgi:myo-inositol-1(or 4)-monophosphatase
MDLKEITEKVCLIAAEAAQFIRSEFGNFDRSRIEVKGRHNFVSYVDTTAEQILTKGLSALLPAAGFITEEKTVEQADRSLIWIVDPLDGTTNFIHGLSPVAISIALMEGDTLLLGVIHEVSLNETFSAWKGGGAWLNGVRTGVSGVRMVDGSLIATGFPYHGYSRMEPFMKSLNYFMHHSHGVRRLGSAATDLAYVACGRFDAFYEYSLAPWDVAAGAILVMEAGGVVTDFAGGKDFVFGQEIIAANPYVFQEFSGVIQHSFGIHSDKIRK